MRVALVHDWLTNPGGAERVLFSLHELYPGAPIYTSLYRPELYPELAGADVRTSFLQKIPGATRKHQAFPVLRAVAFEQFDLSEYDIVISSSHAEAKGVITGPETLHICYCHTPIRYYWSGYHHYLNNPRYGPFNPLIKAVMPYMTNYMRVWDRCAADRVDIFVCNSRYVANRIKKYYRREAQVIHPPVEMKRFKISDRYDDYFLVVGRLIPYKRADIVVDAFNELGLKLKIVGTGTEIESLKARARPNIEFLGRISDDELSTIFSRCLALIFPQDEDFGITPLEAMASGRPVIAYRKGGAIETVVEGKTGTFFEEQNVQSLMEAVRVFQPDLYQPDLLREHALKYDKEVFKSSIQNLVNSAWKGSREKSGEATKREPLSLPT